MDINFRHLSANQSSRICKFVVNYLINSLRYCTFVDQINNAIHENVYSSNTDETTVYQRWHFLATWYVHSRFQAMQIFTCYSNPQVILFSYFCFIRKLNVLIGIVKVLPQEILHRSKENSSIFWQLNDTCCFKIQACISIHTYIWKK